jgi:hypothetical protein
VLEILSELPFNPAPPQLRFPRGNAVRRRHQIIFWVSLTPAGEVQPPDLTGYFPAVFDSAFNDCFLIQESQFIAWSGRAAADFGPAIDNLLLPYRDTTGQRVAARVVPADIWIHRNVRGTTNPSPGGARRLQLPTGIAIVPNTASQPRLPILGLRAVGWNSVEMIIHGTTESVTLRQLP